MADPQLLSAGSGRFVLKGDLNWRTVPKLWAESQSLLRQAEAADIDIDLQAVERSDSSGIALLIEWMRLAKQQQKSIQFSHIPTKMHAIVTVCDLDEVLPLNP